MDVSNHLVIDDYDEVLEQKNGNEGKDDKIMLESNTDRSYFMIGAVIVAGLIIAGAVFIFDTQIFGAEGILSETFTSLTGKANTMIEGIDTTGPTSNPNGSTIMGIGSQLKLAFDMLFI